ncbi:MAG: hypothetical protein KC635_26625, partial [Myxococcales bacterium]|nr:hypothetical protein [Myxococcales bacterium]
RAAEAPPGGDIFIHGSCVTIGCLPLEDGPVSWLYVTAVLARDAGQRRIGVVVSPCRFGAPVCEGALLSDDAETKAVWDALRQADSLFTVRGTPPKVTATKKGYVVK